MDIEYLLWLQDFRISINDAWTPFMQWMSTFAVRELYFFPAFVYWFIRKRSGLYMLASLSMSLLLNAVIKLTACVYRPWIRDARIVPAGDAIKTAGGYSFPSGHTMTATPIYGGLAVLAKNAGYVLVSVVCVAMILVTGFSRNYLGVHTPQDVLVGLIVSALVLWVAAKAFRYLDAHPEKENMFLLMGFLAGVAAIVYIKLKSYPIDYVDGKILVKPESMLPGSTSDISRIFGLVVGRYVEKRWVKFSPDWSVSPSWQALKGIILCAVGLCVYSFVIYTVKSYLIKTLGVFTGRIAFGFLDMFYVVAVWPAVMKLFCVNVNQKK